MTTINLAAVQKVRRQDRYSLAVRALAAKALGGEITEPLRLGDFDIKTQPTANVVIKRDAYVEVRFALAAALIGDVLDSFDEDGVRGSAWTYNPDILCDDGSFASDAYRAAETIAARNQVTREGVLLEAWEEVFTFIDREWSNIETLAARLLNGPVPVEEIPALSWPFVPEDEPSTPEVNAPGGVS